MPFDFKDARPLMKCLCCNVSFVGVPSNPCMHYFPSYSFSFRPTLLISHRTSSPFPPTHLISHPTPSLSSHPLSFLPYPFPPTPSQTPNSPSRRYCSLATALPGASLSPLALAGPLTLSLVLSLFHSISPPPARSSSLPPLSSVCDLVPRLAHGRPCLVHLLWTIMHEQVLKCLIPRRPIRKNVFGTFQTPAPRCMTLHVHCGLA